MDPKAAADESDVSGYAATLPRFYHRVEGSVYLNHMKPLRQSRGAKMPDSSFEEPLPCLRRSDTLAGLTKPILAGDEIWDIDLDAEIAVITDDVPLGTPPVGAPKHIKLVLIANDISFKNQVPEKVSEGFGF